MPNKKMDNDAKLALYAVGNGQIIIYNDMNLWKGNLLYVILIKCIDYYVINNIYMYKTILIHFSHFRST